jgi:two-component system OmpR family sensor kinase
MAHDPSRKSLIGIGILLGLGWILLVFNTVRAIQSDASLYSRIVGLSIPFALALALFAGAIGIFLSGVVDDAFSIAGWTVTGAIAGTAAVTLNIVVLPLIDPGFALALFMTTNAAAGGAVLGLLIGLYDAHQRRLQRDLTAKSEEARTLSQRLSVVNRVLRHDTRTQAQLIHSYTETLLEADHPGADELQRIQDANSRLLELADEARDLQAILDEDSFTTTTEDLVDVVDEAADTVQAAHPALQIDYDMPDAQPVTAPPLLTSAVEHLLSNVVHHVECETPRASVGLTTRRASPPQAELTIADNGPGIPDPEIERTAAATESPLQHSEGIGLWLVTWIVEEADGSVSIETPQEQGVGTVVTLSLPVPN